MPTRVLSVVRGADPGAARASDPSLDLNAFAVADDVELTLLLQGPGVEHAVTAATTHPLQVAGADVPSAAPGGDLAGLLASGVRVLAAADDLRARGLAPTDLLDGVVVVERDVVAALVVANDVTLGCA